MISATSPVKWLESLHCMLPRKLRWRWNVQVCRGNNVCKAHRASRNGRDMGLISALIIIIIISARKRQTSIHTTLPRLPVGKRGSVVWTEVCRLRAEIIIIIIIIIIITTIIISYYYNNRNNNYNHTISNSGSFVQQVCGYTENDTMSLFRVRQCRCSKVARSKTSEQRAEECRCSWVLPQRQSFYRKETRQWKGIIIWQWKV